MQPVNQVETLNCSQSVDRVQPAAVLTVAVSLMQQNSCLERLAPMAVQYRRRYRERE